KEKRTAKETEKIAFELADGKTIETVLMTYEGERNTVCVSSQVGCPVGCLFCATGRMGLKRSLTVGEILAQVYYFAGQRKVSNIVFMGMGEPFLNYTNVLKAARVLNNPLGQNIAARKIVFSTIGITAGIRKLAREAEQFRLSWSLVSPFDDVRLKLIPLKQLESIGGVVKALREYQAETKRRVTIEYVVLAGVNDRPQDRQELIAIARQFDSHVNLIPCNKVPGKDFTSGDIQKLYGQLTRAGINTTIRRSLGEEINAACGQLASLTQQKNRV
ncbi:MAG TPA: 23S rRNA (adenine(2503)-C(2))-methyltransferase RlmN, partial [Candidatus Sulfotelmatobacter sp.]|nr:23S rRNA (adenine(2503)-C(2))-methyltransferase RlmN [Candidatus Sulfotelmatobacter sp.]